MSSAILRFAACASVLIASSAGVSLAGAPDEPGIREQLAANLFIRKGPLIFGKLMCVYAEGSQLHQCDLTEIGPQATEGMPCYCGNSPKGIIRRVPLLASPR